MIIPLKPRAGTLIDRSLASAPTGAFYLFADGPSAPAADACGGPPAVSKGKVFNGPGQFGPAFNFASTANANGFLSAVDSNGVRDLPLASLGFTIAAWVWTQALGVRALASKTNGGLTAGWIFNVSTGTLSLQIGRATTVQSASRTNVVQVGQWTHVAATFSGNPTAGTNQIGLYLNGAQLGGLTQNGGVGVLASDAGLSLSLGGDTSSNNSNYLGLIDHLLIDRRAYGPLEIQDLYVNPFRNFTPSPVLFAPASAATKGAVTRLGLDGYGVRRTGSFAGKIPTPPVGGSIMPWPLFERMVA